MIVKNENYVVDPVVMATQSLALAKGSKLFIESVPISYPYMEYAFGRVDDALDQVNAWLDKANEEGER